MFRCFIVVLVGGVGVAAPRATPEPNRFPVAQGTTWEYRRTLETVKGLQAKTLHVRVATSAAVPTSDDRVVTFAGDYEYLGFAERLRLTTDGVSFNTAPDTRTKPVALFRNAGKQGDTYASLIPIGCGGFADATALVGPSEDVTVPAGTFKAIKITYAGTAFGVKRTMLVWYAAGVGVVKQVYCPESSNIVIELVKHQAGE